ncbi:MAG: flagellar basal-body rod protein FlgF [Rhodospirillales bacterium]|jgi:flagellar basal-body rod protein FlgF|nr:flagellar basal-body rod protein FlgF [Rhodospirillales bacterium]MBT4039427.1 flagellar basal-body rod protein FlgF [Rhodospirillales bacterium]MBT4626569.1 flagellar basal-body rod protein FlgF [Rhodospirillales bacterium]MBT5352439.1 flagellar basal-body rod protein FlgF [Rhodospirillales bacterium]MBT5519350.1 flagellar basal-body rod protein FlgF [Rhodospirillales bacterium]
MENTLFVALSRQMGLKRQMAVVANNIANMNTTGFKGEKMMFVEHVVRSQNSDNALGEKLSYVRDIATVRDTTAGHMSQTGNPLDVAIQGDGYFAIETRGGEQFTRNGRFQLDATGQLVTNSGDPVMSASGQPFFFGPTDTQITISGDGTISTENGALGRLKVVKFPDELALQQSGGLLFNADPQNEPEEIESPQVLQGALESSNVQPIIELTRMIETQRSYDSVKKLIEKEDERTKTMIREILRV